MMGERPERIWLLHDTDDGGGDTWCEDRNPTEEPDEDVPATEYVRADVHRARVAALEAREARLVAALEPFARHANNKLVADAAFMEQAVSVNYGGSSFALPAVYFKDARAELDAVKGDGDDG